MLTLERLAHPRRRHWPDADSDGHAYGSDRGAAVAHPATTDRGPGCDMGRARLPLPAGAARRARLGGGAAGSR